MEAQLEMVKIFNTTSYFNHFRIQMYYQNEPKFNGIYRGKKLPKIADGAYVIYLDESKSKETHCIVLYVNGSKATYFDSFGVEHFLKKIKNP